jgi:hypothetical protein
MDKTAMTNVCRLYGRCEYYFLFRVFFSEGCITFTPQITHILDTVLTQSSHIAEHGSAKSDQPYFSVYSPFTNTQHSDSDNTPNSTEQAKEAQGSDLPKPKEDDAKSTPDPNSQSSQNSEKTKEETNSTEKPADPLRWFGILVPPALRTAQLTFVSAVEGPIPQLVTILRDLRTQEIEIGRIRKQIKKT